MIAFDLRVCGGERKRERERERIRGVRTNGERIREQLRERRGQRDFRDFLGWLITRKATYPRGTTDAQLDP